MACEIQWKIQYKNILEVEMINIFYFLITPYNLNLELKMAMNCKTRERERERERERDYEINMDDLSHILQKNIEVSRY
jgi:hypothetical protein